MRSKNKLPTIADTTPDHRYDVLFAAGIMMTSLVTMATTRQFSSVSAEPCVSTTVSASVVGTGV